MRASLVAALAGLLLAAPVSAQTPPPTPPPAQPAAAPAPAPRPFPEGARVAYLVVQRVINESTDGKASSAKVQALNQKKVNELNEKQKALQTAQTKLQQGGDLLKDEARDQLAKDIERMNRDIQRFTQDAQTEVQDLQADLQVEFQKKLAPIIQQIATEKGLHMIVGPESPILWADPALDITAEVIKRLDAAAAAAQKTTPKPPKN
jgi:outer membrane protein